MMVMFGFKAMPVGGFKAVTNLKGDCHPDNGFFVVGKHVAVLEAAGQIINELRGGTDNAVVLPGITKGQRGGKIHPVIVKQFGPYRSFKQVYRRRAQKDRIHDNVGLAARCGDKDVKFVGGMGAALT